MKILLINPPDNPQAISPETYEPPALEILASTVGDHEVRIVDLRFVSAAGFRKELASFQPGLVGITVNTTVHVNPSLQVLRQIRSVHPRARTVVGGHHPTLVPEDFYLDTVDGIFLGWADKSFPRFVRSFASRGAPEPTPGVILLEKGAPVHRIDNPLDLQPEDIPFPNRKLTSAYRKKYRNYKRRRTALISTSRGCPFRCSFCACQKAAGGRYLVRSAEKVFEELSMVHQDVPNVFFADDNTFHNRARARELALRIRESGIHKRYSGYCRSDTIVKDPELFRLWKEIGLGNLTIGFEAISDKRLGGLKKSNTVKKNEEAVRILKDMDLSFSSYFLIDPDFEEEDFNNIAEYVEEHNLIKPRFVVLTPLPGTDLWNQTKERINMSYDYFDTMHWVYPTRMEPKEFFFNLMKLYKRSFSFRRYFRIMKEKRKGRFRRNEPGERPLKLQNLSLLNLVILNIVAIPLRRKLYRQYFG